VAKVLYWLNLHLGDGSNIVLGHLVVLVGVAQLALVWYLLDRSGLSLPERALGLVLTSVLLFSMNGSWNFFKSMSGAAWLTANLFAVVAIVLRQQDRSWAAGAAASLATICYGTGLAAWPAVLAVGMVRRPWRTWWRELPMVVGLLVGYGWYQRSRGGVDLGAPTVGQLASTLITLLDAPLRGDLRAVTTAAVLVTGALCLRALLRRDLHAAPWVGVAVYGLVSCTFIAYGRWARMGDQPGSRYHSLAAYFWIAATLLVLLAARSQVRRWVPSTQGRRRPLTLAVTATLLVGPVIALSWVPGTEETRAMEARAAVQDQAAAALRLGLGTDLKFMFGFFGVFEGDLSGMRRLGQYPFSDRWDDDCGLLGTVVDPASFEHAPQGLTGGWAPQTLPGGVILRSRLPDLDPIRCVVAVADDDRVIGVGVLDDRRDPAGAGKVRSVEIVAEDDHPTYRAIVFVEGRRSGILLDRGLRAEQIERD
jgi:hypothetical protein